MNTGRVLVSIGLALVVLGVAWPWLVRVGTLAGLGRLPGDLSFGGEGWRVYLPLGTCLVASVVLTLLARWLSR